MSENCFGFSSLMDLRDTLADIDNANSGVSFAGKSLKLDTEEDAKDVVNAILQCRQLLYLNLEGNTLGVGASHAIAKAIEKHPELKKALWSDMFTGRMNTEIPKALEALGHGLVGAGAQLRELDMSDNAFGPIGVQGLAALLRSSSCYALEVLKLNNNGLGITGGRLLAAALTDCFKGSNKDGKKLSLKVFVAGRNRLEDEGAEALAEVFKMIGTLEEIVMPQNGIRHSGISALCKAFGVNANLKIINLNDNTFGKLGSIAMASVLPRLKNLTVLNLGDCLLRTKGAVCLAEVLQSNPLGNLEEVNFSANEIHLEGGLKVAEALVCQPKLKSIILDGNEFGKFGIQKIRNLVGEKHNVKRSLVTVSLEDDEGHSDDEDDEEGSGDDDEEQEPEAPEDIYDERDNDDEWEDESDDNDDSNDEPHGAVNVSKFLQNPTEQNLLSLNNLSKSLVDEIRCYLEEDDCDKCMEILMKVSSVTGGLHEKYSNSCDQTKEIDECVELICKELIHWCSSTANEAIFTNTLLIFLGLLKSEDKSFKPQWNTQYCLDTMKRIQKKRIFPDNIEQTLNVFMARSLKSC